MKYLRFILLLLFMSVSCFATETIKISSLTDGSSSVTTGTWLVGTIVDTTYKFSASSLVGLYLGTLTNDKYCKYNSATSKIDCIYSSSGLGDDNTWTGTTYTLTFPSAAVDSGWTTGLLGFGPDGTGTFVNIADLEATIPISGEITDEQVACWESSETPGTNKLKSCGAKTTDNSTATHLLCKDDSNEMENCTLSGLAISGTTNPTITVTSAPAIPSGTNPTVDAAGEIAIDTTTDQIQYYGGAKRALPYIQFLSFVIPAPAEADDINIMKAPYGMTILGINCIVQGTTSVTGQLQECDSSGANCADLDSDIACDADGAADDGSLTDSAIASGAWLRWKTTSLSGTPTFLTVTVRYSVVAD
jgi:hypothetical protein